MWLLLIVMSYMCEKNIGFQKVSTRKSVKHFIFILMTCSYDNILDILAYKIYYSNEVHLFLLTFLNAGSGDWEWSSFLSKEDGPGKVNFTADSLKSKRVQEGKRPSRQGKSKLEDISQRLSRHGKSKRGPFPSFSSLCPPPSLLLPSSSPLHLHVPSSLHSILLPPFSPALLFLSFSRFLPSSFPVFFFFFKKRNIDYPGRVQQDRRWWLAINCSTLSRNKHTLKTKHWLRKNLKLLFSHLKRNSLLSLSHGNVLLALERLLPGPYAIVPADQLHGLRGTS